MSAATRRSGFIWEIYLEFPETPANTYLKRSYIDFSDDCMTITVMQSAIIIPVADRSANWNFFMYAKITWFLTQFFVVLSLLFLPFRSNALLIPEPLEENCISACSLIVS